LDLSEYESVDQKFAKIDSNLDAFKKINLSLYKELMIGSYGDISASHSSISPPKVIANNNSTENDADNSKLNVNDSLYEHVNDSYNDFLNNADLEREDDIKDLPKKKQVYKKLS